MSPDPIAPNLRPAATVVVLRDSPAGPQVFMVRRHEGTAFMGGAYVFPGGRVDAGDRGVADPSWCDGVDVAAAQLGGLPAVDAVAFHVAALRELFEEAGVLPPRGPPRGVVSDVHTRFTPHPPPVHTRPPALRHPLPPPRPPLPPPAPL